MNDARRYRMNAVECLSAAKRCEPPYRGLILAVATTWHALARQDEAIAELLAIWNEADAAGRGGNPAPRFLRCAKAAAEVEFPDHATSGGDCSVCPSLEPPRGRTLEGEPSAPPDADDIERDIRPRLISRNATALAGSRADRTALVSHRPVCVRFQ